MDDIQVAVIGAGVAGLAATFDLARRGASVEVFEAAPRLGGRCATASRGPLHFDTGAQFFRTDTPAAHSLVLDRLPSAGLVDVRKDVVPFDASGRVGAGDPAQNAAPKWVYRTGISHLPALLAQAARAPVHLGCPVASLDLHGTGWRLATPRGSAGPFAAVVLAAPPIAASRVLERSAAPGRGQLLDALSFSGYRSILSVVIRPDPPVGAPEGVYAMVNSDRGHAVSWLAFEHEKPGYAPAGECVLVAQMASSWSVPRLAAPGRDIAHEAADAVSGLLGQPVRPRWWHVDRWPEALPDTLVADSALAVAEPARLFLAGDAATGGRVHLALESGLRAAHRLRATALAAP